MSGGWAGLRSRMRESGTTPESASSPDSGHSLEMQAQQQEGVSGDASKLVQPDPSGKDANDGAKANANAIANEGTVPPPRKKSLHNVLHSWSVLVHDTKLRKQLQEDDIQLDFLRKRFAEGHALSKHDRPHTWRQKMLHYIHSRPMQILIAALILIDVGLLIAEIIVEMDEAETRVLMRDEQLRFLGDFVLDGLDRPLGGQIARAGCLKPRQRIAETEGGGGFNPFERIDDKEAEEQLESLVLGIKRVRRDAAARNASAPLLCVPTNLTLEQCSAIPPPHVSCSHQSFNASSGGHEPPFKTAGQHAGVTSSSQREKPHRRRRRSSGGAGAPEPGILPHNCPKCATEREESLRHRQHILHMIVKIVNYLSISILFIFLIELILKLICTPLREFIKNIIEVVDAIVVVLSFILDLLTLLIPNLASSTTLIILFLFWRIVRLVNGLMVEEKQRYETRIEFFKAQNESYKEQVEELAAEKILLVTKEMHLRALCRNLGATDTHIGALDDHVKSDHEKARSVCPRHGGAHVGEVSEPGELPECTCSHTLQRNQSSLKMFINLVRSTANSAAAHRPSTVSSPAPPPPPTDAPPLSDEATTLLFHRS